MKKLCEWYNNLSKQVRDSIIIASTVVGAISTILSVLGISLGDWQESSIWLRIGIVIGMYLLICYLVYKVLGEIFKDAVNLVIRQTAVSIKSGNIFEAPGLRIIGCDTHFDTRVDDVVIAKNSLHGQLVLEHGKKEEIVQAVESEAKRLGLSLNDDGLYDFPLGTIVRYNSSVDNCTYLLLAMMELNSDYEAHTNMAKFEHMLVKMWKEISRVYANNDVYIPLLGSGISRFDDGPKDKEALLRCMLCTLNSSGVSLNSKVSVIIYGKSKDIPLYEYKELFHATSRR